MDACRTNAAIPRIADLGVDVRMLMGILDEIDYGVMLVEADARLLFANDAALRQCAQAQVLRLDDDGRVEPSDARRRGALLKALQDGRQGRRCLLTLEGAGARAVLAVVPLHGLPEAPAPVLLLLGKHQLCEAVSIEFFARAHRLTLAEGAVLKGLCDGLRPAQIAEQGSVSVSTVRTQIVSIRAKTETASILELVRCLTVLPPITSALRAAPRAARPPIAAAAFSRPAARAAA